MKNIFLAFVSIVFLSSTIVAHCDADVLKKKSLDPAIFFYTQNSPSRFIIVDKKRQELTLFEQRSGIKLTKRLTSATGKNYGNKELRGDEKTPEGIYFITERHKDNEITVFGNRAFHLDYPNVFDTIVGRQGDGIYIHGTNRVLQPNSTNGCITLNNNDLEKLAPYLGINDTPIIVLATLFDPQLNSAIEMKKDDSHFQEILKTLSISPDNFPTANITNLYFINDGEQAIADLHYYLYTGKNTRYQIHKRVYLSPLSTHGWPIILTMERKDSIPTLLAFHPNKYSTQGEKTR